MLLNTLLKNSLIPKSSIASCLRLYTVIVERHEKVPLLKQGTDPRKYPLKSKHFHYKFVDCLHNKKWGDVDLILTQYVEGVGHKGEIVSVSRHLAYYELLPLKLAVYPTDEYLEMYKQDRTESSKKAKVSPYALKTKEELDKMELKIPINISSEWQLNENHISLALRYNKVMCPKENIILPADFNINSKDPRSYEEPFFVEIKINDYLSANLKCKVVPLDTNKLWEEFTIFHKTV